MMRISLRFCKLLLDNIAAISTILQTVDPEANGRDDNAWNMFLHYKPKNLYSA